MTRAKHPLGYEVDPETGVVYGLRGQPIRRLLKGYVVVNSHGRRVALGHRLVWEAVHGPIPSGMHINHINSIRSDNRIVNLEVVTAGENLQHAYRVGQRSAAGEANPRARLTCQQAVAVRSSTDSHASLSDRLGVSVRAIRDIRSGKNWRNAA